MTHTHHDNITTKQQQEPEDPPIPPMRTFIVYCPAQVNLEVRGNSDAHAVQQAHGYQVVDGVLIFMELVEHQTDEGPMQAQFYRAMFADGTWYSVHEQLPGQVQ